MSGSDDEITHIFVENLLPYLQADTEQIVLGYSGGEDSTVLLHLLAWFRSTYLPAMDAFKQPIQLRYLVVHVNHHLSDNCHLWAEHCQTQALKLGFDFELRAVHLEAGQNIEAQAREQRYRVLASFMTQKTLLLTAQHQDDQVETFLLALKRGAGPKGLGSMPLIKPFAQGFQLRPLLDCPKSKVTSYALDNQLQWINDESNQNTYFERNFLRSEILPQFTQRWPSFLDTATRSIGLIAQEHQLLETLLLEKLEVVCEENRLRCSTLKQLSPPLVLSLIRLWLSKNGVVYLPSQKQLQHIYQDLVCGRAEANPRFDAADYQLRTSYDLLYKLPKFETVTDWHCSLFIDKSQPLPDQLGEVSLSTHKLPEALNVPTPFADEQITIQFDTRGRSCQPIGRRQQHRLRDLFQERQIPAWQRTRLPLLFYNDQLIAVADLFVCDGEHTEGREFECYFLWVK